jgi:hypothetical protein
VEAPVQDAPALDALDELPLQIVANLLPNLVVCNQTVSGFEEREVYFVLVELQQLEKLVQNVRIG